MQRVIATIRTWLREHVPGFEDMKLSDGEIIEKYLIPARAFVQQGTRAAAPRAMAEAAFARTAFTQKTYDKRIDELFNGATANPIGVRVMDRSDVLSMLGYQSGPIVLRERKVKDGLTSHPRMTAEHWKKIPAWLDSPALVFDSDTIPGRIVFFAPEQLNDGTAIMMVLEPATPRKGGGMTVSLLVNAYDRASMPLEKWIDGELLRYYDKEKSPALVNRSVLYMTSLSQARSSKGRIYTNRDLVKYRKDNPFNPDAAFSRDSRNGPKRESRELQADDNTDIRFSRSTPANPANPANATPFRDRMDKIADTLIYNFQDRFKPLRDIQKRAVLVPEDQDAVLAEERYSGMVRAQTDTFYKSMRDPLIKAIHDEKQEYDEVEEYLHARHAPSRNAAMREINPTEQELTDKTETLSKRRDELAKDADVLEYVKARREMRNAEADIEDGIADESLGCMINQELTKLQQQPAVKEYRKTLDALRAMRNVKPFQGDNTTLSGMSNAEAKAVMTKTEKSGKSGALERVSALVGRITTRTREIITGAGLETPETIAAGGEKYEQHVPVHRDEWAEMALIQ